MYSRLSAWPSGLAMAPDSSLKTCSADAQLKGESSLVK